MAELMIRTARHTIRVAAPPRRVYQLLADVNRWPQFCDPTIAVEHLHFDGVSERVRIWEMAGEEMRSGLWHREFNPVRMQLRFRLLDPRAPVASMGGVWLVTQKGSGSLVSVDHYYRVVDDDPVAAAKLAEGLDQTAAGGMTALREAAELEGDLDQLWLSCEDGVDIDGEARDVYDFLARAQDWPHRLPHVDRVRMDEEFADLQLLETDTRLPNGSVHTTNTVRICHPETHIVYKQTRPPAIMRAHTGSYTVTQLPRCVRATARHTVLLRPEVLDVLPGISTMDDARAVVLQVLHGLSLATLHRAREFAEARRPAWAGAAAA